jgi:hypothetical protein
MAAILQSTLPFAPWGDPHARRLPGVMPVDAGAWLKIDDAYCAQMVERARLLSECPDAVMGCLPCAEAAVVELLSAVLNELPALGFSLSEGRVTRPDGVTVTIDHSAPLWTLGHLVQEDFCILQRSDDAQEHVLTAAILCFPASWTLAEKLGRPLVGIHKPVAKYTPDIAVRVQRLFDAVRVGQPLWRANALAYSDPTLHHPRREDDPHVAPMEPAPYIRSERQTLVRLPDTQAVVFSIHTYVVARAALTAQQAADLAEHPI